MDRDFLDCHTPRIWHKYEWIRPLDRLYAHTNGSGSLAIDEGVRSMGLRPNLIFGVVSCRSFNPHLSHSKMGPSVGPIKILMMTVKKVLTPWKPFSLDYILSWKVLSLFTESFNFLDLKIIKLSTEQRGPFERTWQLASQHPHIVTRTRWDPQSDEDCGTWGHRRWLPNMHEKNDRNWFALFHQIQRTCHRQRPTQTKKALSWNPHWLGIIQFAVIDPWVGKLLQEYGITRQIKKSLTYWPEKYLTIERQKGVSPQ